MFHVCLVCITFCKPILYSSSLILPFKTETFTEGLTLLARGLAIHGGDYVTPLVKEFEPVMKRVYEWQRVAAACFYAEVINNQ